MSVVYATQRLSGGAVFASRDASGTTNYDLTASALLGSAPTLGAPSLSEGAIVDHSLTASGLTSSAPMLGTPSLSEVALVDYALTATTIASAAPTLGSPWILSGDQLDLPDIVPDPSAVLRPVKPRLGGAWTSSQSRNLH